MVWPGQSFTPSLGPRFPTSSELLPASLLRCLHTLKLDNEAKLVKQELQKNNKYRKRTINIKKPLKPEVHGIKATMSICRLVKILAGWVTAEIAMGPVANPSRPSIHHQVHLFLLLRVSHSHEDLEGFGLGHPARGNMRFKYMTWYDMVLISTEWQATNNTQQHLKSSRLIEDHPGITWLSMTVVWCAGENWLLVDGLPNHQMHDGSGSLGLR